MIIKHDKTLCDSCDGNWMQSE